MQRFSQIDNYENGTKFVRADLHIHSYGDGGSYDVTDERMTPSAIIDRAISDNIKIISITDHNSIGNVNEAIEYSRGLDILVIPGVELSTTQGHLLIYCPNYEGLNKFFSQLSISDNKETCNESIITCLDKIEAFGGFGIAAHIDVQAGFEHFIERNTTHKKNIVLHRNLLAMEINKLESNDWYSEYDSDSHRKGVFRERNKIGDEINNSYFPKIMSSDAHELNFIGKNYLGNSKITRIKMSELSFKAFIISFKDYEARIRIEETLPVDIPYFYGIKFDGGLLANQEIKLSKNLNCIIGGRGAGKSTLIESIKVSSGNELSDSKVDSEVWSDNIQLFYSDEVGRKHILEKGKMEKIINSLDETGITNINIESYGQGETAEKIKNCDKDPYIMLKFFDELIKIDDLKFEDKKLQSNLIENNKKIIECIDVIKEKTELTKRKNDVEQKIKVITEGNTKEIIEKETALAAEREFRKSLISNLNDMIKK